MNVADKKGFTPLITAAQFGHVALVAYLVSRGAKIELEDLNGDNALHWVLINNKKRPMYKKIKINKCCLFVKKSVFKGYPDLTRLLIIYGLNPKKIDNYGQSLLHLACLSGNLNIIQHLVEEVSSFVLFT